MNKVWIEVYMFLYLILYKFGMDDIDFGYYI